MLRRKAAVIRGRIVATVTRRAPQVMVKVTGGGRGMTAIAAHFRYISKNGRLQVEDDRYAPDAYGVRGAESTERLLASQHYDPNVGVEVRLRPGRVLEGRVIAADTGGVRNRSLAARARHAFVGDRSG